MQSVTDIQRWRRMSVGAALLVGIPVAAWLVAQWIVAGETTALVYGGLAILIAIISVNILNDWRFGVYLSIGWLLFEDLVRKYLGNNMAIYFGKDLLVGITYVSFLFAVRRGKVALFRPPFLFALSLFFWFGVLQIFNPNSPSFWYGLLGAKLYFYYVPLMFVGYALVRSEEDLRRLLVWNLVLAGVISLLGIIQAIIGPEFLNPTKLAPEIATLGRLYRSAPISGERMLRPNSVFVSDGRFFAFLELMWLLGLGSAAYLMARTQRGRKYVLLGVALVAAATLLSGSRGAFVYAIANALILASAFLRGAPTWQRAGLRKLIVGVRWAFLIVAIALVCLAYFFPSDVGSRWAFYSETLSPESPAYDVTRRAWDYPVSEFLKAFDYGNWVIGHGIGTASLGVKYVGLLLGKPLPEIGVESGFGCMILEMGILGPILWLIWTAALLCSSWKILLRVRGTPLYAIGFPIFWFAFLLLLPFTYGGLQPYQNFILNAYFWLLIGILFRLPDLAAGAYASPRPAASVAGR